MASTISPKVEKLARALSEAAGEEPDKSFGHDAFWTAYPEDRPQSDFMPAVWCYSPNWMKYARKARKIIFKYTGSTE
jgi:hypothetical protein